MSKFDERMSNIFNVDPIEIEEESNQGEFLPAVKPSVLDKLNLDADLKTDYDASRQTYEDIIEKGKNAIDDMLAIARETEHPRAFEVVATLLKTVTESNDKLIDLQKKVRDLSGNKEKSGDTKIKNAIFVGSTAELAKMVKDMRNDE